MAEGFSIKRSSCREIKLKDLVKSEIFFSNLFKSKIHIQICSNLKYLLKVDDAVGATCVHGFGQFRKDFDLLK